MGNTRWEVIWLVLTAAGLALALCTTVAFAGSTGFEEGLGRDGETIGSLLPGVVFTSSGGNDWTYCDCTTGNYNARMENAPFSTWGSANYWIHDHVSAWLGVLGDWGRIDFLAADATYFTTGYSSNSTFYLEAYDSSDVVLDSAVGPANTYSAGNTSGGLGYLTVKAPPGKFISYVKVHDTGDYWTIDNVSTDATGTFYPPPGQFRPEPPSDHVRHFLTGQLHAHWMGEWYKGRRLGPDIMPAGLETKYRNLGYEFIAPTEHQTGGSPLPPGMFEDPQVSGIIHLGDSLEDTGSNSHILAAAFSHDAPGFNIGLVGGSPPDEAHDEMWRRARLDNIRVGGNGLAFVAHPDTKSYLWSDQTLMHLYGHYDGMEVFTSASQSNAIDTWTTLLKQGKVVHGIASDDYTPPWEYSADRGCVTVVVDVPSGREPDGLDIKTALAQGRFYTSYAPLLGSSAGGAAYAPQIEGWWWDGADSRARLHFYSPLAISSTKFFTHSNADRGEWVSIASLGGGRWEASYTCSDADKWVRAEVKDELGRISLTQAVWLDRREGASGQWQPASAILRTAQVGADTLVVELADAHLELPGADPEAQAWGELMPQERRPEAAPPLGYFGYCYQFQTNAPVPQGATLTIAYDPGEVQLCGEDALAIYRYELFTGEWLPVISVVDTVNNRVRAGISQLGMYAVSGELPEDITPPTVDILVSPGAVLSGEMELSAEITDDNGVALARFMLDDVDLGTDTTGRDGWSVPVDFSVIAQGNHVLRVIACDASGNEGEASASVVVSSSVLAPIITIDAPASGGALQAQFQAAGTWTASGPLISGLLSIDELPVSAVVSDGNGNTWTANVSLPWLDPGVHTLRVVGNDEYNNTGAAEIQVVIPCSITGQVRVRGTTTNIPGATVAVYLGGELKGEAATAPNGIYQIGALPDGQYVVTTHKKGYVAQTKVNVAVTAGQIAYVNFNLQVSGKLKGQVTERTTGAPIIGATVIARSGGVLRATATTTAPWGIYEMDTNLPAGTYSMNASAVGYVDQGKTGVSVAEGATTYVNFRLTPPPRLKGQVRDKATGAPIIGATVEAYLGGVMQGSATTSAPWGIYEAYSALPAGSYVVQASNAGYLAQVRKDIAVGGSGTTYVNFSLQPEVRIHAAIQGPTDGNLASKIDLKFYPPGSSGTPLVSQTVSLDGYGDATLGLVLAAGTYDVWGKVPTHLARRVAGWVFSPGTSPLLDFGLLLAGDCINDNVVNQADVDYMTSVWFTNDPIADVNRDGVVNSADYSFLVTNWGEAGDS